jgi:hypothetical protein
MAHVENATIGLADAQAARVAGNYLGQDSNGLGIHGNGSYTIAGTFGNPAGVTFKAGDVVDVVAGLTTKTFWVRTNNGNWNGSPSANPLTDVGGLSMASLSSFNLSPAVCLFDNGDSVTAIFNGADLLSGIPLWGGTWDTPHPTNIVFVPVNLSVFDNAPAGTVLATAVVSMSDGSKFTGTLTSSDTAFFRISGMDIVTARALTPADEGVHTTTITAHQAGNSLSIRFSL